MLSKNWARNHFAIKEHAMITFWMVLGEAATASTGSLVGYALLAVLLLFFSVTVVESFTLLALSWAPLRRCLLDALLVNLLSILPALGLTFITTALSPVVGLVGALIVSVIIEGLALNFLRRHPSSLGWRAAVLTNLVSYAILGLLVLRTV